MKWVLLYIIALSAVTFCFYGADKYFARSGMRRIRERTLHLLDLAGGWPGGLFAQRLLHHKTRDGPFQRRFWATVLLHAAILAAAFWLRSRS